MGIRETQVLLRMLLDRRVVWRAVIRCTFNWLVYGLLDFTVLILLLLAKRYSGRMSIVKVDIILLQLIMMRTFVWLLQVYRGIPEVMYDLLFKL